MKLKAQALGILVVNYLLIVVLPVLWVYVFFVDKHLLAKFESSLTPESFLDGLISFPFLIISSLFLIFPLWYMLYMGFYSTESRHTYQHLSFSYVKSFLYVRKEDYFYPKVFDVLEDIFTQEHYKKKSKKYNFEYDSKNEEICIGFYEKGLNTQLVFRMDECFAGVQNPKNGTESYMHIEEHDLEAYRIYFDSLKSFLFQKEKTKLEKQALILEQEQEKIRLKEDSVLEKILNTIADLKTKKKKQVVIANRSDVYTIEFKRNNIIVMKNQSNVFMKCSLINDKPIVFLADEPKGSKKHQRALGTYLDFINSKHLLEKK